MTSINPIDYFKTTELDAAYDFNKDGTVDAQDYAVGYLYITDDVESNDINFTKEQLDQAFAGILSSSGLDIPETTPENANSRAEKIIEDIDSGSLNPTNVKTLNELQITGKKLSSYIKEAANISKMLEGQIPILQDRADKIAEEREEQEREYDDVADEVEDLTVELQENIARELAKVEIEAYANKQKSDRIIANCIENYKDGAYPNEDLQAVIIRQLAQVGGWSTSKLEQYCATANNTISSKCDKLEELVKGIREITQEHTLVNTELNRTKANRVNVLNAANRASSQYQLGYEKRLELRNALVENYKVDKTAGVDPCSTSNAQLISLGEFVNNGELDDMPFADAMAVMFGYEYVENGETKKVEGAFTGCGMSYNPQTGALSIPKGHGSSAQNIYNKLVQAINKNYGVNVTDRPDEEFGTGEGGGGGAGTISRSDPISFTKDNITYDFISDRDGDGTFDDKSEFLGYQNGWAEMEALDINKDGMIMGDELKTLNMVAIDNTNGQYSFTTAADAGVTSIRLSDYTEVNQKQNNGDMLAGTFKVKMGNDVIEGKHTLDTQKNIENKYATIFGSDIADQSEMYEENPFLEEFVGSVNTKHVEMKTENTIASGTKAIDDTKDKADNKIQQAIINGTETGKSEKKRADAKAQANNEENTPSSKSSTEQTEQTSASKKKLI